MMPQLQLKPKQRQAAVLALACFTSALCFQGLLSAPKSWDFATKIDNDVMTIQDAGELQMHRYLLTTLDEKHLMGAEEEGRKLILDPNEGDEGAASSPIGTQKLSRYLSELSSYTLEDAMAEADMFKYGFAVLVYDPPNDTFWTYYPKQLKMKASYLKIAASARYLSFMLRRAFPERFTPSSDEFAVSFSSGDYPTVDVSQLPHAGTAPVLHFSSVFRDEELYRNMVAMPMAGVHSKCFAQWFEKGEVCKWIAGEPFNLGQTLEWEDLKPQVIWRGTDYRYMSLLINPNLKPSLREEPSVDIKDLLHGAKQQEAVKILRESYDQLLPRWKGIVMTNEAELAAQEGELPWVDIKFPKASNNNLLHTQLERAGVVTEGEHMSLQDQAKYKYLIDLGGGGGTTWTGTHTKLAMPGLLFHHITPTKDFFHDRIKPYVHYVPVSPDLSDLKEKFDWAESNPEQAKKISDKATEFMRYLGTPEGYGQLVNEHFIEPLRKIIDSYQPISTSHPTSHQGKGKTWVDIIEGEPGHSMFFRTLECKGFEQEGLGPNPNSRAQYDAFYNYDRASMIAFRKAGTRARAQ